MANRIAHLLALDDMARKKGPKKFRLGTYLPIPVYNALLDYSEESGVPMTIIVQRALTRTLAEANWPIDWDDEELGDAE